MKKKIIYIAISIAFLIVVYQAVTKLDLNPNHQVGDVLDNLDGVAVYYNGGVNSVAGRHLTKDGYNLGLKFQCVEFVKRYYYEKYQFKMPNSYGHAKDFFNAKLRDGQFNKMRGVFQYTNPSKQRPEMGNLVIYSKTLTNPYGHVAIVSNVELIKGTIEIIQQNAGPFSETRETYSLKKEGGHWLIGYARIKGWLGRPL